MTKLESIEHKIFASEAPLDEIGQFGSALDTTKLNTKDVTTIQALPAYTKGWGSAIISDNDYPTMEEMNGVLNVMSYHTGYLYQEGMPAWRSDREYSATSIVKEPTGTKFFHSLKDGNIGNTLDNTEYWEELKFGGSGLEVGDISTALYVNEAKNLRRYLNGQIVDNNKNTKVFIEDYLLGLYATNPEYFTTEENWQAEALLNIDGCVYKFVLNYSGADVVSVRLPKYPDYVEITAGSSVTTAPVAIKGNGKAIGTNYGNLWLADRGGSEGISLCYNAGQPSAGQGASSWSSGKYQFLGFNTNPSLSGITGTADLSGLAMQQTKLKLRYFIQIATGSETENNIINEIELNNPYSLFDSKYSDHELNNLSWLKSEGQWNSKAVYTDAYDKLLKVQNGTETIEGLSVKLSTETYTDYDFVLNTADETFRLPLKTKLASGKAVVGNGMTLGFTTGSENLGIGSGQNNVAEFLTSFYGQTIPYTYTSGAVPVGINKAFGITTDPTKSGIELSDSGLYLYFYVGETAQNANLIDAGRIGEQLADKIGRQECKAYITETYQNGTSGYRIWSDGYCEQWGHTLKEYATITFLKRFINTNYQVYITPNGTPGVANISPCIISKSNIGANIYTDPKGGENGADWKASGYLASGQY